MGGGGGGTLLNKSLKRSLFCVVSTCTLRIEQVETGLGSCTMKAEGGLGRNFLMLLKLAVLFLS